MNLTHCNCIWWDGSDKNGYESHTVIVSDGSDKNGYESHTVIV